MCFSRFSCFRRLPAWRRPPFPISSFSVRTSHTPVSRFFLAPHSRESTRKLLSLSFSQWSTGPRHDEHRSMDADDHDEASMTTSRRRFRTVNDHARSTITTCRHCLHTPSPAAPYLPTPHSQPKALEIPSHSLLTRPFAVSVALQSGFRVLSTRLRRPVGCGRVRFVCFPTTTHTTRAGPSRRAVTASQLADQSVARYCPSASDTSPNVWAHPSNRPPRSCHSASQSS